MKPYLRIILFLSVLTGSIELRAQEPNEFNAVFFMKEGTKQMNSGKYKEALMLFLKALDKGYWKPSEAYYSCGLVNKKMKNYDSALYYYDKAIAINPNNNYPYSGKGIVYFHLKEYREALQYLNIAIELDPLDYISLNYLGNVYWKLNEFDSAFMYYDQTSIIKPTYTHPYQNKANIYFYRLKQYENAIKEVDFLLILEPDVSDHYNLRGYLKNLIGEYKSAILDFNKTIELDTTFKIAFNNRGYSKLMLGDSKGAIKDINYSLIYKPNNPYAHYYKGLYYLEKKRKKKAQEEFILANKLDSTNKDFQNAIKKYCTN